MNAIQIKKILEEHNLQLNKRLGQNFLIDNNILDKIIATANLSKQDTVLEIGSGLGTLTKALAPMVKKIITIEKDTKLIQILTEALKDYENIEIIHDDILKIKKLKIKNYRVISNLPYYITSPVIRMFLESDNPPQEMILMIQKEVAQRICASPRRAGQAPMNLLAIATQFYANPKIMFSVSKNSFWPRPKIDSAIIRIGDIKKPEGIDIKRFFQIVKAGFSSPRKQLANNLENILDIPRDQTKKALAKCGLDPQARAQNLTVDNWERLILAYES